MHGGASGIGAPIGNSNALRHGRYTVEAIKDRRELNRILREAWAKIDEIEEIF
jgi:hypothetical protein